MSNELDEFFAKIDEDLSLCTPKDIDDIIAYMRKARSNWIAGVKPKKETGPKVSLDSVMQALAPVTVEVPAEKKMRRF